MGKKRKNKKKYKKKWITRKKNKKNEKKACGVGKARVLSPRLLEH
jgi:hypothetical protein